MDSRPPLELGGPRRSVIRLNRRVIYVVIGALAVTVGVAVYAIRTQGTRLQEPGTEPRPAPAPSSAPWFQGVPEYQAPPQRAAILDTASPPATAAAPKAPTTEEDEAQRQRRLLRAAMSAPIGVATFERSGGENALRRRAGQETPMAVPAGVVVAADRPQAPGGQPPVTAPLRRRAKRRRRTPCRPTISAPRCGSPCRRTRSRPERSSPP